MEHGADSIVQHINEHFDALPPDATAEARFKAALLGQMSALIKFGDYALAHGRLLTQLPEKVRERIKRRERHQQQGRGVRRLARRRHATRGRRRRTVSCVRARLHQFRPDLVRPEEGSLEKVADQLSTMFFEGVKPAAGAKPAAKAKRSTRKSELVA